MCQGSIPVTQVLTERRILRKFTDVDEIFTATGETAVLNEIMGLRQAVGIGRDCLSTRQNIGT